MFNIYSSITSYFVFFFELEKNHDILSLLWSLKLMKRFGMASLEDKSEHTAGPKCGKRCCYDWFLNKAKKLDITEPVAWPGCILFDS